MNPQVFRLAASPTGCEVARPRAHAVGIAAKHFYPYHLYQFVNDKGMTMAESIATREQDYSQWYQDVVRQAELAETSDVRGCMVIRPHGFAIWENMQRARPSLSQTARCARGR